MVNIKGKLSDAIFDNQPSVLEKLLFKKPSLINCTLDKSQVTLLIKAVSLRRSNIVKLLLNCQNIDLDRQNVSGETAAMRAAKFGYLEILKQLSMAGCDLRIEDYQKKNALDYAMIYGQFKTAKFLVAQNLKLKDDLFYRNAQSKFARIKVDVSKMRLLLSETIELRRNQMFSEIYRPTNHFSQVSRNRDGQNGSNSDADEESNRRQQRDFQVLYQTRDNHIDLSGTSAPIRQVSFLVNNNVRI